MNTYSFPPPAAKRTTITIDIVEDDPAPAPISEPVEEEESSNDSARPRDIEDDPPPVETDRDDREED